jgi:hypothetical protein
VTLSVSDGVVTDTLTRTNYLTVSAGIGYTTTTRVITYTYDPLYRLTGADYRSTGLTAGSSGEAFSYAYDAVGNRTEQTRLLTSTTVMTYHYDHANRLDYFYTDGVLTDLDWDANPLRCAARTSPPCLTPGASRQLAHPGHERVYLRQCRQPAGQRQRRRCSHHV